MSFAQSSGRATYGVKIIDNGRSKQLEKLLKEPANMDFAISKLVFNLDFSHEDAVFYVSETRYVEPSTTRMAVARAEYSGRSWQDKTTAYLEMPANALFPEDYLITFNKDFLWKVSSESKMIGDYTCYKATGFKVYNAGGKEMRIPIIAWFCPEIPYSFGPLQYGGLPGLIMELQTNRTLYGLISIDLKKNNLAIAKMPDWEKITEDEHQKRFIASTGWGKKSAKD